ncbi:Cytochrome c, mono-and diheme variants [Marinobacter daqiaonensis]|uniref:Cytochrome c, mono-and diheme variants n=1 Tax=Marinobacter daqiaonensis TaxID=650891 RepID=A0A1I6GQI1_9GAMM|nr:cytochrome c [Marinobacter daqiaonensis]SFR44297.1 Cytochrome c, mono-and diheme variants [Marinobacter daqiaonensis]
MTKWIWLLVLLVVPAFAVASGGSRVIEGMPADLIEGQRIYEQYCAACHGLQGEGAANWQKPDEKGEMPAPPHDESGHTWRHSDAMLFRMIAEGWRHPFNKSDRLTMPAFRDILTDEEIRAVIDYLRTFWTGEQRLYQQTESQDMPSN